MKNRLILSSGLENKINIVEKKTDFSIGNYLVNDNVIIRIFNESLSDHIFDWHRDEWDRIIYVLSADPSWKLQLDDSLPTSLEKNKEFFIQKELFHKLHKGKGTLVLLIKEINKNVNLK